MKKKISAVLAISMIASNSMPAINVFADEVIKEKVVAIEKQVSKNMTVGEFKLKGNNNFSKYNELYQVKVTSIKNNGGNYPNSQIEKAIDGNLSTHWETNNKNTDSFKNEVIMELEETSSINRLAYATRQDGAKTKGYPIDATIYVSESGDENDFVLAGSVTGSPVTGNMVEFKFDTVKAKKVKFVFDKAHNDYASASEFWLYKEDEVLNSMERLFIDDTMSEVSQEFASTDKLGALEKKVKEHPFHDSLIEDIENARKILENNPVDFIETKVSKLLGYGTKYQEAYDSKFMLDRNHIVNTQVNGGTYFTTKIEYMYDGDPNTHWETNKNNDTGFTNEVVFTFDEIEQLDRIALLARNENQKGFPTKYEIYASETSKGDTFKLVSSGTAKVTKDFMQFKFNPTNFKRLKFVFKECHGNRPFIAEARFYKQDAVSEKMDRLFTDSNRNVLSDEFKTIEALNKLDDEAKTHPLYNQFKEDLEDAKYVLEGNDVQYVDAKVSKFKTFGSEELAEYDKDYKLDIASISTNGGNWSTNNSIDKAIDGNIETNWHSKEKNSETHTNEVVMTLDKLQTLDKIVYTSQSDRGFAQEFEIYTSKTLSGDTFTKVTHGTSEITKDSIAIKFNPTQARRVKFVYKQGFENFALASEFGLYKEDATMDKMGRLFTDNTMSQVSEEFNSIEAITTLEEECKKHPFYNDFKEDLENAKNILEQEDIVSVVSATRLFNHLDNKPYIDEFMVPYDNIKNITNNAGKYNSQTIDKAADNDINTYWETDTHNSENWGNEVTVEFVNPVTIDRLVYGARQNDAKGFAEEFEIYGSTTSKGETFKLVATGKASKTKGLVEAKFQPTKFKRIKLKWTKGDQNWATLNEIMFFRKDAVADKVNDIFVDKTQSELKPEYKSKEALDKLEKEIASHQLKVELEKVIERARKVLNNSLEGNVLKLTLPQNGDIHKHATSDLMMSSFGTNFISTGVLAKPGDVVEVYVDAEEGKPLPQIMFSQAQGHYGKWQRKYNLQNGYNRIEVPEIYDENWAHKTNPGGAIYFINPYTPEEQGKAPTIVLEGGQKFPIFNQGDDEEAFLKELAEYNDYIEANPDTAVDIFEYNSPRVLFTGRATDAHQVYNVENVSVSESTLVWSKVVDEMLEYAGLEDNPENINHDSTNIRTSVRIMQPAGAAYASNDHVGLQQHVADDFLRTDKKSMDDIRWGNVHELGHQMDIKGRTWGEVTNNMWPNEAFYKNGLGDRVNYKPVYSRVASDIDTDFDYGDLDLSARLGLFWQLRITKSDYWTELEKMYRNKRPTPENYQAQCDILAEYSSELLGYNLTEHFERYGMKLSDECKTRLNKYPKLDKKIWYANNSVTDYKGNGFSEDVKVEVSTSMDKENKTNTLKFSIDNNNRDDLLGYEILKDGKVLGFTTDTSFIVNNVDIEENAKYDVVAYAKDLSTAKPVSIKAFQPRIETVGGVTLGLHEEFDPLDYVKAYDYEGNVLSGIKVVDDVDNNRKGEYTVTYEITDRDITSITTMKVDVVSKYDYLSDREWDSVAVGYGTPSRNKSIKGRTLGEIKDYEKGIRLHANGNAVYNLGEHDYEEFEVKVGVDMNVVEQDTSSITFKIVGDGKTLATTKVLKHADNMQYINVPVKGVKELRLEVNNGGNGNTSDHGIFVEPKLTVNNAKPELTIPKSQIIEVGQTLDNIAGKYAAVDAEDGDITSNVVITGVDKVNLSRPGRYTLTYTVTDKDGNTVEKSRVINVVHPEDITYLSDFEWESATSGWKVVLKDKSVSGDTLKLTGQDNNEVVYEKGIGTHAESEIVYDLTDKDATLFSTFIGVDRAMYNGKSSVEFKIYVDDELAYSSGIMGAKDPSKYVELDIEGAKKLKLVATTAGDGKDSDHADWADAKLYFVNTDRIDTTDLDKAIEDAKKVNKDDYTEDSIKVLEDKLANAEDLLKEENPRQGAIDTATSELQESIKGLVRINLDEVVNIPDECLAKSLSKALGKEDNFTIGDMRKLTNFNIDYGVVSLEGLQYAKNLEIINGENNEIRDLRPISKLENLKEVNFNNQFVQVGQLKSVDGVVKVNTEVYNRSGKNVATKVKLVDNKGNLVKEKTIDKNTKEVDLDVRDLQSGFYGVHVTFEDPELSGTLLYMASI